MEGQNIRFLYQLIQGAEVAFVAAIGARRIAEQRFDPQRFQALLQAPADVADADDPDGTIGSAKPSRSASISSDEKTYSTTAMALQPGAAEKPIPPAAATPDRHDRYRRSRCRRT
jgi:hypothetical protein